MIEKTPNLDLEVIDRSIEAKTTLVGTWIDSVGNNMRKIDSGYKGLKDDTGNLYSQNNNFAQKFNVIDSQMEANANKISAHSSSINQLKKKFKHTGVDVPAGGTYTINGVSPNGGMAWSGTYLMHFYGYSITPSFGYKKVILFTISGRAFNNIPIVTLSSAYFGSAVEANIEFSLKSDLMSGSNAYADFEIKNNSAMPLSFYVSYVQINDNI